MVCWRPSVRPVPGTLSCLAVLVGVLLATPAWAYTQYRTKNGAGCGLRWYAADLDYHVDERGLQGLDLATVTAATRDAFDHWEQVQCTQCASSVAPGCAPEACAAHPLGVRFHDRGTKAATPVGATCRRLDAKGTCLEIEPNGNFLTFVQDPAQWNYGQFVFALTVLTFNKQDGAIADADVLLDDADFDFCSGDGCGPNDNDLCNTLTHEVGHFLGLDHSQAPEATMFATAPAGETGKCTLHADDQLGVCTAYRTACSGEGCPESDGGSAFFGCQARRVAAGAGALGLLLLGLAVVLAPRRRRPGGSR